jgi:hypothetical protein
MIAHDAESADAPFCDPVLDELRQPFVRNFRMTFAFTTPRRFNRRTRRKTMSTQNVTLSQETFAQVAEDRRSLPAVAR